jgi:hypothetical protein
MSHRLGHAVPRDIFRFIQDAGYWVDDMFLLSYNTGFACGELAD